MSQQEQLRSVVRFYETHPINEFEILEKLRSGGIALEGLCEDVLQHYDQDHFGGLEAVDVRAKELARQSLRRSERRCSEMPAPRVVEKLAPRSAKMPSARDTPCVRLQCGERTPPAPACRSQDKGACAWLFSSMPGASGTDGRLRGGSPLSGGRLPPP
jgi:hypothetical protein